jgi:hypothetical protein
MAASRRGGGGVSDIRYRLEQLLSDSGAYQQGRQDERERLQHLIDIRIYELQAIDRHLSSELLNIRQQLEP